MQAERGGLADLARPSNSAESMDAVGFTMGSPIHTSVTHSASASASSLSIPGPAGSSSDFPRAKSVPAAALPAARGRERSPDKLPDRPRSPTLPVLPDRQRAQPPSSPLQSALLRSSNGIESPRVPPSSSGSGGRRLHHSELAALKQRFRELDESGRGFLSKSEFYKLFQSVIEVPDGVDGSESSPLFDFAFNLFDSHGGEGLDMKEFISGCWILMGSEEERIRHLFHMYDKDGSGTLNLAELQQVFRVMRSFAIAQEGAEAAGNKSTGIPFPRRNEPERNVATLAERALAEQDVDGDGQIGFEDFQRWCANDPLVMVWMDHLSHDTARGIARLREEQEKQMLAKELNEIGLMDKRFWQESFSMATRTPDISRTAAFSPRGTMRSDPVVNADFRLVPPVSGGPPPDNNTDPDVGSSSANSSLSRLSAPAAQPPTMNSFVIQFERLTFERRIGEGSFAEVYSGRWLDSPVAIKVFKSGPRLIMNADGTTIVVPHDVGGPTLDGESFDPNLAESMDEGEEDDENFSSVSNQRAEEQEGRTRFMQEVSLLTSLRHPHVLLYIGACVEPQFPLCIVSQLIDGGSLYSLLHQRGREKLTLAQKMMLTQDIARGMLYLHSRTPVVLHRDLKSANILVERQQNEVLKATIIDFGLSKLSSNEASLVPGRSNNMGLCGSLVTMAPEIMARDSYVAKSDVYSFGIIVWEIFTGRVPFRGMAPGQLVLMVSTQKKRPTFRASDQVPDGIRSLIEACWEHEVDDRIDFFFVVRQLRQIKRQLDMSAAASEET